MRPKKSPVPTELPRSRAEQMRRVRAELEAALEESAPRTRRRFTCEESGEREVVRLLRLHPERYDAVVAVLCGAPVSTNETALRRVAVSIVKEALVEPPLPNIPDGWHWLEVLLGRLGVVDRAFPRLDVDVVGVQAIFGRSKWEAHRIAAYLIARAGACGLRQIANPTKEDLDRIVGSLRDANKYDARKKKPTR